MKLEPAHGTREPMEPSHKLRKVRCRATRHGYRPWVWKQRQVPTYGAESLARTQEKRGPDLTADDPDPRHDSANKSKKIKMQGSNSTRDLQERMT